jgi:hypothetical protein
MNEEIRIYFFVFNIIFSPFVIYKGYIDGQKYYIKNGCDTQYDLIKITQDGLENYTIFMNVCFYGLVFSFINYLVSILIFGVKYLMLQIFL